MHKKDKKKDTVTTESVDIPVYHEKLDDIKKILKESSNLGMILIDGTKFNKIEHEYGTKIYSVVLENLKKIINGMRKSQIREDDIITLNHEEGDQIYIFLSKKRDNKKFFSGDLESSADRLTKYINDNMFTTIFPLLKKRPKISIGYAFMIYNSLIKEERLINKLIEDAKIMADYQEFKILMRNKEKLQELIIKEEIITIYQPIINMLSQTIIGYEALSRGPKGTEYENPYVLFNIAEETGLLFELDRLCRRRAFINAKGINDNLKLFVNILPTSIHDPEFKGKYLKDFLKDIKISARSVVLEVSERQVIENFDIFREASNYYSDIGFAIAIDDTGTGYSSLKSLIKLELEYIKIDISLIRDIDKNLIKRELVKAIDQVANNVNAKVIAEGIETKDEMKALVDIGIIYGQGFLFGKPETPFSKINFIEI